MAAPTKKRNVNLEEKKPSKESRNESDEGGNVPDQTVIEVEFEGRNPIDSDFHGIKQLLSQLFLKAHINLSELTELIISQNYVGSVIKQAEADDEDDGDEEDSDPNEVFGITTVINLTEKQKYDCVTQLRNLLLKLSTDHGSPEIVNLVEKLLSGEDKPLGLLINERFVNIPSQISLPLLKSLRSELRRAVEKKMAYDFSYLILISKLHKIDNDKKKSKKAALDTEVIWSNPEEEVIDQEVDLKFEFSVKNEADSGLIGEWDENDEEMTPMRRVLLIPYNKFDDVIQKVEEAVSA